MKISFSFFTRIGAKLDDEELANQIENKTIGLGRYIKFTCQGAFLFLGYFGILCPLINTLYAVFWPVVKIKSLIWTWINKVRKARRLKTLNL